MYYKYGHRNKPKNLLLITIVVTLLAMALGCTTEVVPQESTTETISQKQKPLARLSLVIEPPESAVPLFNPTPLSDDNLSFLFG